MSSLTRSEKILKDIAAKHPAMHKHLMATNPTYALLYAGHQAQHGKTAQDRKDGARQYTRATRKNW